MGQRRILNALILTGALVAPCMSFSAGYDAITPYQTKEGIGYMSGGVGVDERAAMEDLAGNYNLKLVFANKSGAYLSDVKVDISNAAGRNILSVVSNGPWFFAMLPAGHYKIDAEARKNKITQSAVVDRGSQIRQSFYWAD